MPQRNQRTNKKEEKSEKKMANKQIRRNKVVLNRLTQPLKQRNYHY